MSEIGGGIMDGAAKKCDGCGATGVHLIQCTSNEYAGVRHYCDSCYDDIHFPPGDYAVLVTDGAKQ